MLASSYRNPGAKSSLIAFPTAFEKVERGIIKPKKASGFTEMVYATFLNRRAGIIFSMGNIPSVKTSWLFTGLATFLIGVGLVALRFQPHITQAAEISCLVAGSLALTVSILVFFNKKWRFSSKQVMLILGIALVFFLGSLLYHDDYSGGEFGYNIHMGFPYSWREGGLYYGEAVAEGISVWEYISDHPEVVQWSIDYKAVIIDTIFWINSGVVLIGGYNVLERNRS